MPGIPATVRLCVNILIQRFSGSVYASPTLTHIIVWFNLFSFCMLAKLSKIMLINFPVNYVIIK